MTNELYKRYQDVGLVMCPPGEYNRLKHKLDAANEQYDCTWDNSFKHYIFESRKGNSNVK